MASFLDILGTDTLYDRVEYCLGMLAGCHTVSRPWHGHGRMDDWGRPFPMTNKNCPMAQHVYVFVRF